MPAKPLTELPPTILHAARRACLTLLIDQHRVYLDPPLPMLLSRLRDDAGDGLSMEPLGRPKPLGVRKVSEATDSELSAMTDAVDALLGTCRDAIDDPALLTLLADLRGGLQGEKDDRVVIRSEFKAKAS
jgi:hypothetical protein